MGGVGGGMIVSAICTNRRGNHRPSARYINKGHVKLKLVFALSFMFVGSCIVHLSRNDGYCCRGRISFLMLVIFFCTQACDVPPKRPSLSVESAAWTFEGTEQIE